MKIGYSRTIVYSIFMVIGVVQSLFLYAQNPVQVGDSVLVRQNGGVSTSFEQDDLSRQGFYAYKLENGLEVYVQEDFATPTMRLEYVTKAGTQRQTSDMTGFYQLYTRLFWQNDGHDGAVYDASGAGNFSAQGGTSQSRYSFTVSAFGFKTALAVFATGVKNPRFSDSVVIREFDVLKDEVTRWAASAPGFINSAVDARVFSVAPWTKDSGVYPALFASSTVEEVRKKLSYIEKTWYIPDQSAIFISGPLDAATILAAVKAELASWESGFSVGILSDAKLATSAAVHIQNTTAEDFNTPIQLNSQKLFVLVSENFSTDFIQAVLQYTAPGLGAYSEYSVAAWAGADIMHSKLISAGMGNTDTAFIADAADSRIIIQALFDVQRLDDDTDISLLVPRFAGMVNDIALSISKNDVAIVKERSILFRNEAYTGSTAFMDAIAENWAYGGTEYFFEWLESVENLDLSTVQNTFGEPWIFVLMHPDMYDKNSDFFAKVGYTEVTPKTSAWYSSLGAVNGIENDGLKEPLPIENLTQIDSLKAYTAYTKSRIAQFNLTSGIPVSTQEIPKTPWSTVLLTIDGGEILYGPLRRGTESVAVKNLLGRIQSSLNALYREGKLMYLPDIQGDTQLYFGQISITCLSQDIPLVLQTVSESFKNLRIIPSRADELFFTEAYDWRIKSGSLDYQLYAAAMETLYSGSLAEDFFNAHTELLLDQKYSDVSSACEALYDPSRLSIVVSGNIHVDLLSELEKNFGKENFSGIDDSFSVSLISEVKPVFSSMEQIVRLNHTFLTDISADLAGPRPEKLIPTTNFLDPAQMYFVSPPLGSAEEIIFTALLYELANRLSGIFKSMQNPPATAVVAVPGTGMYPVSSLRFSTVLSSKTLTSLVEKSFSDLLSDLESECTAQRILRNTVESEFYRKKEVQGNQVNVVYTQLSMLNTLFAVFQKKADPFGTTILVALEAHINELAKKKILDNQSALITTIKNRYTYSISRDTETLEKRAKRMQEGMTLAKNPALYLDRYTTIENELAQNFYTVFKNFMDSSEFFWVFSDDTK